MQVPTQRFAMRTLAVAASGLAIALGAAVSHTGLVEPYPLAHKVSKADPYTDGARLGRPDPHTDGARIDRRDPDTDGA